MFLRIDKLLFAAAISTALLPAQATARGGPSLWGHAQAKGVPRVVVPDDYGYGRSTSGASPIVPAMTANDAVDMILRVPAGAELWLNGVKTKQTKSVRHFASPPLEPGYDYYYDIRVRWIENGQPVQQTRRVVVHAGGRMLLNLMDSPRGAASAVSEH